MPWLAPIGTPATSGLPVDDLDALHQILGDWTVRLDVLPSLVLLGATDCNTRPLNLGDHQSRHAIYLVALVIRISAVNTNGAVWQHYEIGSKETALFSAAEKVSDHCSHSSVARELKGLVLGPKYPQALLKQWLEITNFIHRLITKFSIQLFNKLQPCANLIEGILGKELINLGHVTQATQVNCFVLGSQIEAAEAGERKEWSDRVVIQPLLYNTFIKRAEARMLGLRAKLVDAPFLKERGIDGAAFIQPPAPIGQTVMDFAK